MLSILQIVSKRYHQRNAILGKKDAINLEYIY